MRHGKAQIGGCLGSHFDFKGGFVRFDAGVQVHQPGDGDDFGRHQLGQPFELLEIRALQRKLDLFVATHAVQQARMRDGDAWHLLKPLAQCGGNVVGAALARLAINQPDVKAGVHLSLSVAGIDGGQRVAHFRKTAHDGINLLGLGLGGFKRRAHRRVKSQ